MPLAEPPTSYHTHRSYFQKFQCNRHFMHVNALEGSGLFSVTRKWHEQFVQPRFIELFSQVPTYWEKDDHDHRFNDCDPHTPVRGGPV